MSNLRICDRVVVEGLHIRKFSGYIVGESRSGSQWKVVKFGRKSAELYHKKYCRPATLTSTNDCGDSK